jgi:hypothetical protein
MELSTTSFEVPQDVLDDTEETTSPESKDSPALLLASAVRYPLLPRRRLRSPSGSSAATRTRKSG